MQEQSHRPDEPPAAALKSAFADHQAGRRREAEAAYKQILRRDPNDPDALHLLGQLAHECGHQRDAETFMRRAIELRPDIGEFRNNFGAMLLRNKRAKEAAAQLKRAVALDPRHAESWNNLGAAMEALDHGDAAVNAYRKATEVRPNYAGAYSNLAAALEWVGQAEEATRVRRRLIEVDPANAQAHSAMLTGLLYHAGDDAEALFEEHKRWAAVHETPLLSRQRLHSNPGVPGPVRVLRVGYVAPDFRSHPMARFFAPLLAFHDRKQFSITCYSHASRPDGVTDYLKKLSDHWVDINALSDYEADNQIRADGIDILVDLCGHMPENRLQLFARRPAPVQVTYLGYPATTGMASMDWRIVDEEHDPPGLTERFHTERLARIPDGCWCYRPDPESPAVNDLPCLKGDPFTFAMLNRMVKVTPAMARLWGGIIRAVPGSRFMFLATGRGCLQKSTFDLLAHEGFPMDRLISVPRSPRLDYLRLYHRADLSLDPFPYAGHTTTCDAIWMGVATVSLAGRTHVARAGCSVLKRVGLDDFVARSPQEYAQIAIKAAGDRERLSRLRQTLRQRMTASSLCQPVQVTRGIESAYRQMWRDWCERGAG